MAKFGKIGSLPHGLREQINVRILDNQPFKDILQWLNPLPIVKTIIKDKFQGTPVNEDNLTNWKNSRGYQGWLAHRDARDYAQSVFGPLPPEDQLLAKLTPDKLAQSLVAEYATILQQLHDEPDSKALWTRLRQVCADLSRLRRDNLAQQRFAFEQAQAAQRTEEGHVKWTEQPEVRSWLYAGLAPDTMELVQRDRKNRRPPFTSTPGRNGQNGQES